MNRKAALFSLFAAAMALAAAGNAVAGDRTGPAASQPLPGVEGDYRIVNPAPEPDEADSASGQFKIGDMDVRIGGTVTVDIRAGDLRPPQ